MKTPLLLAALLSSFALLAQEKRSPTIVVLKPQKIRVEPALDSIAQSYRFNKPIRQMKKRIREENGPDFTFKAEKEIEFLEDYDISSALTFGLNYWLSFKFFEYFQQMLIYPAREQHDSSRDALRAIARKHDVNWVIDLKTVSFFTDETGKKARVAFQLYNEKKDEIVLEEEILADDINPGFEFSCEDQTINCVINNSVSLISPYILNFMGQHREYWR